MKRQMAMAALLALCIGPSAAQDGVTLREVQTREAPVRGLMIPAPQGDQVRVSMNLTLFVPGPPGLSEQSLQAQEQARRAMDQLAVKECAVLRETIASDCRIESMSVNGNQHPGQRPPGMSVQTGMTYRITLR